MVSVITQRDFDKKYWTLKRIEIQHHTSMHTQLQDIIQRLPSTIQTDLYQSSEINKNLRLARKHLRNIRLKDLQYRNVFLDSQQIRHRIENNTKSANIVHHINKAEPMPTIYKKYELI